jgi:hypothetical protein
MAQRIACRTPKATNTHSACAILIAVPLQQLLHECTSILRYTYIAFLVIYMVHVLKTAVEDPALYSIGVRA